MAAEVGSPSGRQTANRIPATTGMHRHSQGKEVLAASMTHRNRLQPGKHRSQSLLLPGLRSPSSAHYCQNLT